MATCPCEFRFRSIEACDETRLDEVFAARERDRNRRGWRLTENPRRCPRLRRSPLVTHLVGALLCNKPAGCLG